VRKRHGEALLPDGVLGVLDDGGARDDGPRDGEHDVGVTGDDLPVVLTAVRVLGGRAGGGRAAGGEAAAELLGEEVHVGQQARHEDPEVQVAVQEDRLGRRVPVGR
jgi:hypothetical protein